MKKHYALILGASSGFGKSISLELAKDGVNIIGVHLDRATTMPDVNQLIEDIRSKGVEAHFFNVNAADASRRDTIISEIQRIFSSDKAEECINQKQIEMTLDVMANSLVYWTQAVIFNKLMVSGGKIYAMTSSGGSKQIEFYGAVSAAKACLESYVRQLAMELGHC